MIRWMTRAIAALLKPKALLVAENLCLRQQLIVLQRRQPRPRLLHVDRQFWIQARRWYSGWRDVLMFMSTDTYLEEATVKPPPPELKDLGATPQARAMSSGSRP